MNSVVKSKSRNVRCGESTLLAQELFHRGVYDWMGRQGVFPFKGFAAIFASKRRFSRMLWHMFLPSFSSWKAYVAKDTKVRPVLVDGMFPWKEEQNFSVTNNIKRWQNTAGMIQLTEEFEFPAQTVFANNSNLIIDLKIRFLILLLSPYKF